MLPQIIIHFKVTSGALHSAARAHLVILLEEKLAESLKKAGFFFFFEHMASQWPSCRKDQGLLVPALACFPKCRAGCQEKRSKTLCCIKGLCLSLS